MTLQLHLSADLQARLQQEAERRGQSVEAVVLQLLDERLPIVMTEERRAAAIAMLKRWEEEDAALTEEELAANEEVLRAIDENRPHRKLFADILKDAPK